MNRVISVFLSLNNTRDVDGGHTIFPYAENYVNIDIRSKEDKETVLRRSKHLFKKDDWEYELAQQCHDSGLSIRQKMGRAIIFYGTDPKSGALLDEYTQHA